jgi:hypothetical protein
MDQTILNRLNRNSNEGQINIDFNGQMLTKIKDLYKNVYLVKDAAYNQYLNKIKL